MRADICSRRNRLAVVADRGLHREEAVPVTAADHEWGGRMHDDLIDALDWAVAKGIADRQRVGFFGASYGGYSALTAATKTPEVFACIVDVFGISNLITFMATVPPYWGPWFSIWKNRLGDPATEAGRAFLTERSPLTGLLG